MYGLRSKSRCMAVAARPEPVVQRQHTLNVEHRNVYKNVHWTDDRDERINGGSRSVFSSGNWLEYQTFRDVDASGGDLSPSRINGTKFMPWLNWTNFIHLWLWLVLHGHRCWCEILVCGVEDGPGPGQGIFHFFGFNPFCRLNWQGRRCSQKWEEMGRTGREV